MIYSIRSGSRSRSRSRSPMDMDRPPQARRPCREYEEQGHCPRGADCPYDHRPADAMVADYDYDYRGPVCPMMMRNLNVMGIQC
jgi:hypothetical protein